MTQFSAADIEWFRQRNGAEAGIWLLTVEGPELPGGILRLARNTEDVVSRGEVFHKGWFDPRLPDSSDASPMATLTMSNVDFAVSQALEAARDPFRLIFEMVRPSEPDRVIPNTRHARLQLRKYRYDALSVTGELSVARLDAEPFGPLRMTEAHFPWLGYV